MLPQGFEFPTCAAQSMWAQWHLGIASQQIGPLKKLRSKYRADVHANKRHLVDKAGLVMDAIELIAKRKGNLAAEDSINQANCWLVWNDSFADYLALIYPEAQRGKPSFRPDDIYYTTLHKRHTKMVGDKNQYNTSLTL